jgi:hypothetical protein
MHAVFVQCDDGGYINVGSVYRWSVEEDVTNKDDPFTVKAHFGGPQHPIPVCKRSTKSGAQSTLDNILRQAAFPIHGGRSLDQPSLGIHD